MSSFLHLLFRTLNILFRTQLRRCLTRTFGGCNGRGECAVISLMHRRHVSRETEKEKQTNTYTQEHAGESFERVTVKLPSQLLTIDLRHIFPLHGCNRILPQPPKASRKLQEMIERSDQQPEDAVDTRNSILSRL